MASECDGGNRLKGDDSETGGVVEVGGLIAASFCCRAEMLGAFSSDVCNGFALLPCDFDSVLADSNNGEVAKEKTGGADEAAG